MVHAWPYQSLSAFGVYTDQHAVKLWWYLQGRPIFIQHLGAINYKKMAEVTTEDRMIRFHVQEYERCARCIMPACSIVAGRHIDQTFAIIDVKGKVPIHLKMHSW